MKLPLVASVATMLTARIMLMALDFAGIHHPNHDLVAEHGHPNENVATLGFQLLEIHQKWLVSFPRERFDIERSIAVAIDGTRSFYFDSNSIKPKIIFARIYRI